MKNNTDTGKTYRGKGIKKEREKEYGPLDAFSLVGEYVDMATAERVLQKGYKTLIKGVNAERLDALHRKKEGKKIYVKPLQISTASLFKEQYGMSRAEYVVKKFAEIKKCQGEIGGSYYACALLLGYENMSPYCIERDKECANAGMEGKNDET